MAAPSDEKAVALKVPSKDPKDNKDKDKEVPKDPHGTKMPEDKTKKGKFGKDGKLLEDPDELTEEHKALKEGLDLAVTRTSDSDEGIQKMALDHLSLEIRTATTSMTSVPMPLKFLRPHYETLKQVYTEYKAGGVNKLLLADILSVLSMTMAKEGERESLRFKLLGNTKSLGEWGHEYLRALAGEIGREYAERNNKIAAEEEQEKGGEGKEGGMEVEGAGEGGGGGGKVDMSDIMELVDEIVPFHLQHNAEAEAVDLLVEVQQLSRLLTEVNKQEEAEEGEGKRKSLDKSNYERVCLYLLRMANYNTDPEDLSEMLLTAFELYRQQGMTTDALRVALRMDDLDKVGELFAATEGDKALQSQMGFILSRHRSAYEASGDNEDDLNNVIGNETLSEKFLTLGRDLDVMEAKTPEDIYKSHLAESGGFSRRRDTGGVQVETARANLASTFVNAFVNAGYGKDALMTADPSAWLYKNKDHGKMSAAASLGMVLLWDVEEGLSQIDKFMHSSDDYIKAGAALAVGIISAGVRNEADPTVALLSDNVEEGSHAIKCASVVGLGIAYAGQSREDVLELLSPVVADTDNINMVEVGLSALSLGLIFVGTCNDDVASVLAQRLMESSDAELDQPMTRFVSVALGLLFLGKMEKADAMDEVLQTIEHKVGRYSRVVLETCAYAATGNVLKVQSLLHMCAEHLEEDAEHQMAAVLGIALVTLGDDIGSEMALRTFDHLLHYGELPIRRTVPLALALLHVSNPDYSVVDQLSRLSHDADAEVQMSAIMGLGLVSAGTNNSRVAQLLRQLSEFYTREANQLFIVRIAQGLNHMGKGLLTLHPFHSDRLVLNPTAMGAIITIMFASMHMKATLLDKHHYMLYYLAVAICPRMLLTVDEENKPLPVTVRVGQAVEVVGQAGKPKSITGFQTHTTPVLLGVTDRAELATDQYIPVSGVLEGVVILKKNPDWEEPGAEEKKSSS